MLRPTSLAYVSLLAWLLLACGGHGDDTRPDPGEAAGPEALLPDVAFGEAVGPADVGADPGGDLGADAGIEAGPTWVLPPCYRACDRVTACGVAACVGYDWASAGALFEACFSACDASWADALLAAAGCPDVTTAAAARLPGYEASCAANPCDAACDAFAACVVEGCEAVDAALQPSIATDCHGWCTPASSVWMGETPCADLLAALSQGDPTFETTCHGAASACQGPELCDPWGAKMAGCIAAHCEGNADPYQAGLAVLLSAVCQRDAACPSQADVQAVLDPSVTCDTAWLQSLGHDAPFTALCEGSLGVEPGQVQAACQLLATCPGAAWLAGVDGCSAFLAVAADVAQRTQCLLAAVDCTGAYACLEGL